MRVLVMGLPGSGKTTLANALALPFIRLNADEIRREADDWDFSVAGRLRQARRMRDKAGEQDVIADFVCPLPEMRTIFNADYVVWVDTIPKSRYSDTNMLFVPPEHYDCRVTDWDKKWVQHITADILAR